MQKNYLEISFIKSWEYPAITEKQAFYNHTNNSDFAAEGNLYLAVPWASIIDYLYTQYDLWDLEDFSIDEKVFSELLCLFKTHKIDALTDYNLHTVCQHVHWKKLVPLWDLLNIKNVYLSHMTKDIEHRSINFHPWFLSAANFESYKRREGLVIKPISEKRIFCSFVGAYQPENYRSSIRKQIADFLSQTSRRDIFFSLSDKWFFNSLVYEQQMGSKNLSEDQLKEHLIKTKNYNEILSDSIFSLCPEGSGPNTIRLWESMSVGSIPVLFENDWVPPEIPGIHWEDICVTIPKIETPNLIKILESIDSKRLEILRLNCVNAYQKIRLKTCF